MSWQEHLAQSADRAVVDLVDFCRIPSVSTDPDHTDDCRRGAEWVVVSQGDGPVLVTSTGDCARIFPPRVEAVNSIGCGDCMAGAIALALDKGREPLAAISYGIAAAADNLATVLMGRLDRQRVEELVAEVRAESIPIP